VIRTRALLVAAAFTSAGCRGPHSMLDPRGAGAEQVNDLWWVLFWPGAVVFVAVTALMLIGIYRRRRWPAEPGHDARQGTWIGLGGVAIPLVILFVVLAYTVRVMAQYSDTAREAEAQGLRIRVIGHQWWWELQYLDTIPTRLATTANEIHIPVGKPVQLLLESRDVNHSFWVPKLQGKIDLVPGQTNTLWIQANEPGVYRGQCGEYCGEQHAHMAFLLVAQPEERFEQWLEEQLQPAREPADSLGRRGREVFQESGCALCHAVRGTNALARVAPDLTHMASRQTLAAGTIPNTRGYLGGWIANPQAIKPGNRMPAMPLSGPDLQALLAYLESLR
jgi:cytochrome c oxidase subunit II